MTVTLELSPERKAALESQAQARGLTIEQWLLLLADQTSAAAPEPPGQASSQRPIWEVTGNMANVPSEDLAVLPKDGASQIDHYLYGLPKREE